MNQPLAHKSELAFRSLLREFGHLEEGPAVPKGTFAEQLRPLYHFFERIHYTWLTQPIESLSRELIPLALAALPQEVSTPLSRLLDLAPAPVDLSPPVRSFFLQKLAAHLKIDPLVPLDLLPPSPCRGLGYLDRHELIDLAARLGLYDFAAGVKQTLQGKELQRIESLLSSEQKKRLERILREKDPYEAAPLPLKSWGSDVKELSQQLQLQGLKRMGLALAHEERSLLWHIAHRLDQGRGQYLIQESKKTIDRTKSRLLGAQIERHLGDQP